MKKRIKLLLFITMVLPCMVCADMGAPMTKYKVRVSNPDGAYLYTYNQSAGKITKSDYKIEYEKVILSTFETIVDDQVLLGQVCYDETQGICGYIREADTSPMDVKLDDYYNEYEVSYYVFDETCYLYKGPAKAYGKVDSGEALKVGYTFSSNYYDDLWVYVPEKKAWVYHYTYTKYGRGNESAGLLSTKDNGYSQTIVTMETVNIYNSPKTKDKVLATIPANTKLVVSRYYNMEPHYPFYYITYEGVSGFIETVRKDDYITNIAYPVSLKNGLQIKKESGLPLYENPSTDSSVLATIPKDTLLDSKLALNGSHFPAFYKVEYDGKEGWVEYKYEDFYSSDEITVPDELSDNPLEEKTEEDNKSDVIIEDDTKTIGPINNPVNMTLVYVIVGVVVALGAVVTIILVNRKKKIKEVQDEEDTFE